MLGAVGRKLNRDTGERKALFRDLVSALILHGHVETTVPRAKETKKIADGLVDLAVSGSRMSGRSAGCLSTSPRKSRKAAGATRGSPGLGCAVETRSNWPWSSWSNPSFSGTHVLEPPPGRPAADRPARCHSIAGLIRIV